MFDPAIAALHADGPAPGAGELGLFGQFVGSWHAVVWSFDQGREARTSADWHWAWILEGRAIQDVWISPSRRDAAPDALVHEYGTAVRFYDARLGAWRVTWNGPVRGRQIAFVAHEVDTGIVLEGRERGRRLRWMFSEIEPQSFHWHAVEQAGGARAWVKVQEMWVTRQP